MPVGSVHLFKTTLDQISHHGGDAEYFRLLAGDTAFFSHRSRFADSGVLDALRPGQELLLGCHALDDGAYWLHWLNAPGAGSLVPKRNSDRLHSAMSLAVGLCLLLQGALVIYLGSTSEIGYSTLAIQASMVAGALGFGLVLYGSLLLAKLLDPRRKVLRRSLESALAGETDEFEAPPARPQFGTLPSSWHDESLEVKTLEGRVHGVGHTLAVNTFKCGDKKLGWLEFNFNFSDRGIFNFLNLRSHPFFLADDDRVRSALSGEDPNPTLPDVHFALSMANFTDRTVSAIPFAPNAMRDFYRKGIPGTLAIMLIYPLVLLVSGDLDTFDWHIFRITSLVILGLYLGSAVLSELFYNHDIILTGRPSKLRFLEAATQYSLRHFIPVEFEGFPARKPLLIRVTIMVLLLAAAAAILILNRS